MQHIASRPAPADRVRRFDAGKAVRAAWALTPGEAGRRMQALGLAGAAPAEEVIEPVGSPERGLDLDQADAARPMA